MSRRRSVFRSGSPCAGCWPPSPTQWKLATSLRLPTPRSSSRSASWSRARQRWQPRPAPKTSGLSASNNLTCFDLIPSFSIRQRNEMTALHSPASAVKLIFSKSNIDIVANTPEVGEAKESLPVMYKGREFSIAFNPEFLMAPLRNLSEDEIYLDLIDEMSPGVIKIAGPFLYVLMPVRLS